MTLDDYKKKVAAGRRVLVKVDETRMGGTACNLYSAIGKEYAVKLDNGKLLMVSDRSVQFIHLEDAN